MSKFPEWITVAALTAMLPALALADGFGLGREALPEEISAWDLDVSPDGTGLPDGSGSVLDGEMLFEENCAVCHGSFAEGVDNWPKLAGGMGTLDDKDPLKTVGSYWPYLSTVWDYVHRSMPFGNAQTLSPDEVYAITAYILYSNDLVDDDFVLSRETFHDVEMPNADGFFLDDRAEVELPEFTGEPCMSDCKDTVEITMRARVLDVTPDTGAGVGTAEPEEAAAAEASPEEAVVEKAAPDPDLVAAGEAVFRKCKTCHMVGDGAKNRSGPVLNGIVGSVAGQAEGFRYSRRFKDMAEEGLVWTPDELHAFLADPRGYAKGTRMTFKGLDDPQELDAIVAYLASFPE